MRFLACTLPLILAAGVWAQSGRVPPTGPVNLPASSAPDNLRTVKQLYDEANGYVKAKAAEFEAKKAPFSETLLNKTKLEQRQLAAKNATIASARTDLAGDDLYYLGMLHWIAQNLDGTAENLTKFVTIADADVGRQQTARSVLAVVLAKQKKLPEAEAMLAAYLKTEPTKLTERARVEGELAKAYQSQKDFARMAPHAEEDYKAAKALLSDNTSHARGLDEILDAGMLVFEAYRDGGNRSKADGSLDDLQATSAASGSPSFYYYAVDQKIRFLIETGRKAQAMQFYADAIDAAGKSFLTKGLQADAVSRLKQKEKHYKLLGDLAPEFDAVDHWLPEQPRTFAAMKGKVILLDFWAPWCGPCIEAFPSLIEWRQDFASEGFEILGVTRYYGNARGIPADKASELDYLKQFKKSEGLTYPFVVSDGQALQVQYGAMGLPTAVLIDRKGVVRYIETGTSTSRLAELREMIVKLLAEK